MSTIRVKRSSTPGNVPASLAPGELAVNQADGVLYWADNNSVIQSTPLYGAPIDSMASNNLVFNGGMEVSQRYGAAPQTVVSAGTKYITDGFYCSFVHNGSTFSCAQGVAASAPVGFNSFLSMRVGTPITTYAAGDYALVQCPVEGYKWWKALAYGTSVASACTVGFWVFATISGTACFAIRNAQGSRSYIQEFAVVANTWTFVTFIIPPDTTGTWDVGANTGATLSWTFGCGTTYAGATNKTWSGNDYVTTNNVTNFFGTTNNMIGITGVFVLPGSYSVPAARSRQLIAPYSVELDRSMRYFETGTESLDYRSVPTGITYGYDTFTFLKPKRVAPSVALANWTYYSSGVNTPLAPTLNNIGLTYFQVLGQGLTNFNGWSGGGTWTADASL